MNAATVDLEISKPVGALGIHFGWANAEEQGSQPPHVVRILQDQASEEVQQKFQIGDVLISINGNSIRSIDDIGSTLSSVAPGDVLHFQVSRKHHEKELDKEVCATKIQSIVRGKEARKTVAELREKQKEREKIDLQRDLRVSRPKESLVLQLESVMVLQR
eukprot:CAMPEP_0117757198 /NCGR_PEP_ID=MMETSP0947-20121206/14571_1 /TAXON_ID=44440 /ORGANISM="Chattonella subsalsa, Strain CCMP2191" /LENGTH=160 /DNA_ID=CAMNT_0005577011 /DNA_START=140 /DNA_END=619 /DNA_ORIENTATION=+